MLAITWGLRLLLLILLAAFALQNTGLVALQFVPGQLWQAPLVVVLLVFFVAGVFLGVLLMLMTVMRQRREISRFKQRGSQAGDNEASISKP